MAIVVDMRQLAKALLGNPAVAADVHKEGQISAFAAPNTQKLILWTPS